MSQEVSLIFSGFVSVLFMLVGVFGIYKKRKLARSTQTMHKLNGVQVDYYAVDDQDEDGFTTTSYFPIYEYEYGGIKQQLRCDYGESGKRYRNTGRRVHILIDPQTEKAVCLEDETKNQSIFAGVRGHRDRCLCTRACGLAWETVLSVQNGENGSVSNRKKSLDSVLQQCYSTSIARAF